MLRIVHLSDLHVNNETLVDVENYITKSLIKDLKNYNDEKEIDFVIISGDLIDKGGASFKNDLLFGFLSFEEKIIDKISRQVDIPKSRFFFVPGNHDIKRNADEYFEEVGLNSTLNSIEDVNKFIDSNTEKGIKRILSFKSFEKAYFECFDGDYEITNYQSCFKLTVDNKTIGICCFNSAWRCYESINDKGNIVLGERQVLNACNFLEECDFKVAVMHHPIDWLRPFEQKNIENSLRRNFDILFTGHVHEGNSEFSTNTYGSLFISVAPTNWVYTMRENERSSNSYSIIDYTSNTITIHNRRYSHRQGSYVGNTDIAENNGITVLNLPNAHELAKRDLELELVQKISDLHSEELNEHLLSYNTDTLAPKTIEGLFVLPTVVSKTQYNIDKKEKEIKYTMDDLCSAQDNLLILGTKESGKTVLLDRIIIELTNNVDKYHKIPVYVDLEKFYHSRIETAISLYLGVSVVEIKKLIEDQKLVLLLDNLNLSKSFSYKLKEIDKFIEENPGIQVITTCNTTIEGELPLEIFDYKSFSNFKTLNINSFRTKEIKQLIQNWFSKNVNYDTPEKLKKLVMMFSTLNIPRTPLAVSMFLWIIEQQGTYRPINNATMLENFIEKLFKKQSKNEIYSETFDYRNKERLLTHIAHKMYECNNQDYEMKYVDLRNHIHEYLKLKKFDDFQEEDVLQHFISKGIFVLEGAELQKTVRFRFNCFFKYFLMKNMEYNSEFKDFVLQEENFLRFTDEIDYYTGLKRDQSDILKLIVERMNKEYQELIAKIETLKLGFDTFFETKKSIASALDDNFVKKMTEKGKPTDDELDQMNDRLLDNIQTEKGIEKKDKEIGSVEKLERLWILASKVLKNTEETDIENLKADSYRSILISSMAFSNLYKYLLVDFLASNQSNKDISYEHLEILNRFLPMIHQSALFSLMGTAKLSTVIREKIESEITDENISDFEKYISVFLYSDIKGKEYLRYIEKLMKNTKRKYINDMILFKLLSYYYLRSNTIRSDLKYESLMAEIIVTSKGLQKGVKGQIMQDYREKKTKKLMEGDTED